MEEYTLLLCITPEELLSQRVIGGETVIYTFGGAARYDTTTPGRGVIFRKDLEHEGMELKQGEKHVITCNLWAVRKEESTQVLLVTFPTEEEGK